MLKNGVADVLFGTNAVSGALNTLPTISVQGKNEAGASFAETFNSTAGKSVESGNENSQASTGKTVVENKPVKEVTDVSQQPKKESVSQDEKPEVAKEIADGAKEVVDEIKKTFDVTDEEIEEAMETLMLSFEDLFNLQDLQNLLMEVTGTSDSVELLTNVELYDGMKDIVNFMENIKEDIETAFNISDEAFTEITTDNELFSEVISTLNNQETVTAENDTAAETKAEADEEVTVINQDAPEKTVTDNSKETDSKVVTKDVKEEIKVEVNVEETDAVRTDNTVAKITTDTNKNEFNSNGNSEHKSSDKNSQTEIGILSQNNQPVANTVADIVETVQSYSNVADTENIMRQVTEYVKVNISSTSTSMEMQLHPASLGTVNMQVVSQNGQVTAQFTVQNEAVKAVLESQLMTLQESLNEAGTKVSAIEVTVANYNLERGMDNSSSDNGSNNSQKGSKRRSINLNGISSFDELDEEDLVEAKMMEANGNTVNFRA